MRRLRTVCGALAVVFLLAGANGLAFEQSVLELVVAIPLGIGAAAGLAWLVLAVTGLARHSLQEGKVVYGLNTIIRSVLFLGICVAIYAFVQHGKQSWDLTKEGRRKLSDQTIQVLSHLDKDVDIICFFLQVDDELVRIASDKTTRFLEQCQQYTTHLKVEFLDPQIERVRLEALNITHASTQGTVVIRCGTRQKVITLSGGSPRLEERDFTNSLINVVRDAQPKVCFLTGHGERSIDDKDDQKGATLFRKLLEGESYAVEKTAIMMTRPEVAADCDVLAINGLGFAGPQSDLLPDEIHAIQAFLDRGGRLLILLDPWTKVLTAGQAEQLLPWLAQRFGIIVGNDMAVSPTTKWAVEFSSDPEPFHEAQPNEEYRGCFNNTQRITQYFDQKILFSVARTVRLADKLPEKVVGAQLLRTTPDYFAETDLVTLTQQGKASKGPEDMQGPLSMAVAVTMKTESLVGDTGQTRDARVVVVGDSDFASNGQVAAIPGNLNFILNTMAWLTENEELIAIRATGKEDAPVILTDFDQRAIVWIAVLGTVQAVILAGVLMYWVRRKYQ